MQVGECPPRSPGFGFAGDLGGKRIAGSESESDVMGSDLADSIDAGERRDEGFERCGAVQFEVANAREELARRINEIVARHEQFEAMDSKLQ